MASSAESRRLASLVFIGTLAVIFALQWGPGSKGCDSFQLTERDVVATVNGKPIARIDFAREYLQQVEQLRRQGMPVEMLRQFGLPKQVLDRMVNTELLAQAAEKRGLSASDDDLAKLYAESPVFQKDGKFDHDTFVDYVRTVEGTTEVLFEDKLRRQLAAQRLLQLVEASVVVSDDEVKARYFKDGDTADVTFVRFAPIMYSERVQPPTPAALGAWLEANRERVKGFYETNTFQYFIPERVKARQILLRFPDEATEEQKAAVKARAESVRASIVEGKTPFADVARAQSEDPETKERGGELGVVERLQLPGSFAEVLFALKPGEVTVPVQTPVGYFIGTVEEKLNPEQKPFEAVEKEIAAQLFVRDQSRALAEAEARKTLAAVKAGKSLAELYPAAAAAGDFTTSNKPEAKTTGPFSVRSDTIPQLGTAPAALKAISTMTGPGALDEVVEVADALAVVVVTARTVPTEEAFRDEKVSLTEQAIKAKQFEMREAFIKSLKQTGTVVTNEKSVESVASLEG